MPAPEPDISEDDLVALTMLADGRLPAAEAAAIRARLEQEPALAEEYALQRRAVGLVRTAVTDVHAPLRLREQIEADRAKAPRARPRRWRAWMPAGALGLVAAAAATFVLVLNSPDPSVTDVLSAAGGTTTVAAVANPQVPQLLTTKQDGVAFPNTGPKTGWTADGVRRDEIDGRPTTTVFYAMGDERAAYTIVGGEPLDVPDGQTTTIDGTDFTTLEADGRTIVTWQRGGQTCVISSEGASAEELLKVAAWKGDGAVTF